jgi:hypothetical protein
MQKTEEEKILNEMIDVNQAASDFYREAANNSNAPAVEKTFQRLRRIHTGIVDSLAIAAFRNGNPVPKYDPPGPGAQKILDALCARARQPMNDQFIQVVEAFEISCVEALENAIASEYVSNNIKIDILEASAMLNSVNLHIDKLRSLVSIPNMAA